MSEMIDDKTRLETENQNHFFQIDFMKCLMMVLVIVDHSFTHDFMHQYYSPFWERIAIPLFLVIMGYNMGISFKKKGYDKKSLKEMYSKEYFKSKLQRYVIPYTILYLAMSATYFIVASLGIATISNYPYDAVENTYLGFPYRWWGPGLFFIPVIFTSILIFPLLYKAFSKHAFLTVAATFAIEISTQIVIYVIYHGVNLWNWLPSRSFFTNHVLFFFSAIGMGLWLSKENIISWRSILIFCLLPVSWAYISVYTDQSLRAARETFNLVWLIGDYNFMAFPYSAFLFLVGMIILPKNPQSKITYIIRRISKSTYHILLFQIFYFSFAYHFYFNIFVGFDYSPINYAWHFPLSLVITFAGGMILYEIESRFYKNKDKNIALQRLYYILIALGITFFIIRFVSQFWLFVDNPVPNLDQFWEKLVEFFSNGFTLE